MKYNILLFSIIIALILSSSICFAEVAIYADNSNLILNSSETKTVQITVQNNGSPDTFSLRVFPPFAQSGNGQVSVNLDKTTATIGSNQNATFELSFSAQPCIADYVTNIFTVTASSISNSDIKSNESIRVTTIRRFPVCISKVTLNGDTLVPGQTLTITVQIDNPSDIASTAFQLITNIRNNSNFVIKNFQNDIDIIQSKSTKFTTINYQIPQQIGYGRFNVELILQNTLNKEVSSNTLSFVVQQFEKPTAQKTVKYGILTQDIFLKVRNDGNAQVNASTSETIPVFLRTFITTVDKPDSEQTIGNNVIYTWTLYNLQPGEERTIEYQINMWQIVTISVLVIIAVAYAFTQVFTIAIVKKHKLFGPIAGGKEIAITLEVRNRTRHIIRDVYVRDFLPSFATVVEKFETVKPSIRKVAGGTEIVWKLDNLRSMDERVLTYRIKPTMEILGEIKLPKAIIKYSDKKKQLKKVISKSVSIKL
jgi:hypothetical protein